MRDSVVFYRSFYDAIRELPEEDQVRCFHAIMDYALDDAEPDGTGIEKAVFLLAKPQIDANNRRYQNGTKGGRPKTEPEPSNNQTVTKAKPNNNLDLTETEPVVTEAEPNVNVNENVNVNDKVKDSVKESALSCHSFPLNDGTDYWIPENDLATYKELYPGIDVEQELRSMKGWCLSNPKNRKTRSGAKRFITSWLSRSQNSAQTRAVTSASQRKNNQFNDFPQRNYTPEQMQSLEQKLLNRGGINSG